MAAVYIQTRSGKPLMPTTRCGHVRRLLKFGKARVVSTCPFTVQLMYGKRQKLTYTPGPYYPEASFCVKGLRLVFDDVLNN